MEIIINDKNDESLTFRLPFSLKAKLPGAEIFTRKDNGKKAIKFKDGRAIGNLFRDLTKMYTSGSIETATTQIRELSEIIEKQSKEIHMTENNLLALSEGYDVLKAGATELLKLMKVVKPSAFDIEQVVIKSIKKLREVI